MANTSKLNSERDFSQAITYSFNDVDSSLTVASFVVGKVGRTITNVISTTTSTGDTVTSTYSEGAVTLYVIKTIYTDNTYKMIVSQTRLS